MVKYRIVENETSVGLGKGNVCLAAMSRDAFQGEGAKEANAFACAYMAKHGNANARVSNVSAPYPAADGVSDNDIGSGKAVASEWRVDFRFLSMP